MTSNSLHIKHFEATRTMVHYLYYISIDYVLCFCRRLQFNLLETTVNFPDSMDRRMLGTIVLLIYVLSLHCSSHLCTIQIINIIRILMVFFYYWTTNTTNNSKLLPDFTTKVIITHFIYWQKKRTYDDENKYQ